jgi:hypothetical protein
VRIKMREDREQDRAAKQQARRDFLKSQRQGGDHATTRTK